MVTKQTFCTEAKTRLGKKYKKRMTMWFSLVKTKWDIGKKICKKKIMQITYLLTEKKATLGEKSVCIKRIRKRKTSASCAIHNDYSHVLEESDQQAQHQLRALCYPWSRQWGWLRSLRKKLPLESLVWRILPLARRAASEAHFSATWQRVKLCWGSVTLSIHDWSWVSASNVIFV